MTGTVSLQIQSHIVKARGQSGCDRGSGVGPLHSAIIYTDSDYDFHPEGHFKGIIAG